MAETPAAGPPPRRISRTDIVMPLFAVLVTGAAVFAAHVAHGGGIGPVGVVVPLVLGALLLVRRQAPLLVLLGSVAAVIAYYANGRPPIGLELPLAAAFLSAAEQEIAAHLVLSPATTRTYVSRLLTKLDARDRVELVILAHAAGLV